jgi:ACT domain-containing protein
MTNNDILKEKILIALEKHLNIVSSACKEVGISRETHYRWLREDKKYKQACKEIDNVALDFAESALHQQIKKGNPLSTMFYLKCKAKKRGYIEQQEVKVTGNMKFTADFGEGSTIQTTSESEENT